MEIIRDGGAVPTPKPVVTRTVCSVCGLDWERHGSAKPKVEKCIELLKADVARPRPVEQVWPQPYYPSKPTWTWVTAETKGGTELEGFKYKGLGQ